MIALPCFLLYLLVQLQTARPISRSSLNVELLIAVCLCNHTHLTSIRLSSGGARIGRKINFSLGQHFLISLSLPFWICVLTGYQVQGKYFECFCHIFCQLFLENQQTVSLFSFYRFVHASYHLYGHMLRTHFQQPIVYLLSLLLNLYLY